MVTGPPEVVALDLLGQLAIHQGAYTYHGELGCLFVRLCLKLCVELTSRIGFLRYFDSYYTTYVCHLHVAGAFVSKSTAISGHEVLALVVVVAPIILLLPETALA